MVSLSIYIYMLAKIVNINVQFSDKRVENCMNLSNETKIMSKDTNTQHVENLRHVFELC